VSSAITDSGTVQAITSLTMAPNPRLNFLITRTFDLEVYRCRYWMAWPLQ